MTELLQWIGNNSWILIALVAIALVFTAYLSKSRTRVIMALACGVVLILVVLVIRYVEDQHYRLGWLLALVPSVIILQHALFLRLVRMPFRKDSPPALPPSLRQRGTEGAADFARALRSSEKYFDASVIAVRYGVPALLCGFLAVAVAYVLFCDTLNLESKYPELLRAGRLGAIGAYAYVLLSLGQRNFRHDISSGSAMWSVIVIASGPLLASALAYVNQSTASQGGGILTKLFGSSAPGGVASGTDVVYFFAGLAPRQIASFIAEAVQRLLSPPAAVALSGSRLVPTIRVRGITHEIADRLEEEGIGDVQGLAMADPMRLARNTSYDWRQILGWMDEAILIITLPDHWEALEREGITGAIDLTWLGEGQNDAEKALRTVERDSLAAKMKLEVATLAGVTERLRQDAQVRLIWVLYQTCDRVGADVQETSRGSDPAPAQMNIPNLP